MTETERKALKVLNEVRDERGFKRSVEIQREDMAQEALCRAIYCNEVDQADLTKLQNEYERVCKQHEAFRQEVSDAITGFDEYGTEAAWEKLSRFIIAKPDPLVEVIATALREGSPFDEDGSHDYTAEAKAVASAIRARGLEVRKIGEKAGE